MDITIQVLTKLKIINNSIFSTLEWPAENFEPYLYGSLANTNPDVAKRLVNQEYTQANIVELKIYFEELNQQGRWVEFITL